jgi:hypothetical protein
VIKRANQNKLTLYRRHASSCPIKEATKLDACEYPVWCHGRLRGVFVRRSLETRSLISAMAKRDDLLAGHPVTIRRVAASTSWAPRLTAMLPSNTLLKIFSPASLAGPKA